MLLLLFLPQIKTSLLVRTYFHISKLVITALVYLLSSISSTKRYGIHVWLTYSDVGEIEFHVMSGGLISFGPQYEARAVGLGQSQNCTCLAADLANDHDIHMDYASIIDSILETVG